jgi:hypothetical protein
LDQQQRGKYRPDQPGDAFVSQQHPRGEQHLNVLRERSVAVIENRPDYMGPLPNHWTQEMIRDGIIAAVAYRSGESRYGVYRDDAGTKYYPHGRPADVDYSPPASDEPLSIPDTKRECPRGRYRQQQDSPNRRFGPRPVANKKKHQAQDAESGEEPQRERFRDRKTLV